MLNSFAYSTKQKHPFDRRGLQNVLCLLHISVVTPKQSILLRAAARWLLLLQFVVAVEEVPNLRIATISPKHISYSHKPSMCAFAHVIHALCISLWAS
jgi:hypothetical protein